MFIFYMVYYNNMCTLFCVDVYTTTTTTTVDDGQIEIILVTEFRDKVIINVDIFVINHKIYIVIVWSTILCDVKILTIFITI